MEHEESLADLRERKIAAIEERLDALKRVANSGTQVAPRARSLLEWYEEHKEVTDDDA